jgi:hypothetical protein
MTNKNKVLGVVFGERTGENRKAFPPYQTEVLSQMSTVAFENLNEGTAFRFNEFIIEFDESVHANGWWAMTEDLKSSCRVSLFDGDKFLG